MLGIHRSGGPGVDAGKVAGRNRMITWDPSITTGVRLRRLELKDVEG